MSIGIIGAGGIGQAFARQALNAGHDVILSNSRGPESLAEVVRDLGPRARARTVKEAAASEMVLIAVPWRALHQALTDLSPWQDRIVIDATNPIGPPDFKMADLGGKTSSEIVAVLVAGARVVKACNTLPPRVLAADPREHGGRRVLFMSGDDDAAKVEFGCVLDAAGFAVIDLGGLVAGGRLQQFPGGTLPALDLIRMG